MHRGTSFPRTHRQEVNIDDKPEISQSLPCELAKALDSPPRNRMCGDRRSVSSKCPAGARLTPGAGSDLPDRRLHVRGMIAQPVPIGSRWRTNEAATGAYFLGCRFGRDRHLRRPSYQPTESAAQTWMDDHGGTIVRAGEHRTLRGARSATGVFSRLFVCVDISSGTKRLT